MQNQGVQFSYKPGLYIEVKEGKLKKFMTRQGAATIID